VFAVGKNDGRFGPSLTAARATTTGSPVAPGSAIKVKTEGEMILYTVVALKGQHEAGTINEAGDVVEGKRIDYLEPLKSAFREKRFVVRDFVFDASKAGSLDGIIEKAKLDVQQTNATLIRWCKAHFGELYAGWIHLKVIKTFAESVLRYGLPVDFLSVIAEPNMKSEKLALKSLTGAVLKLRPSLKKPTMSTVFQAASSASTPAPTLTHQLTGGMFAEGAGGLFGGDEVIPSHDIEEEEEEENEADLIDNLPYVCQSFIVVGSPAFK
jgi:hypothetical protein